MDSADPTLHEASGNGLTDAGPGAANVRSGQATDENASGPLQAIENSCTALIESVCGAVLLLDAEGQIVRFNKCLENLTGRRLEQVRGSGWLEVFVPPGEHDWVRTYVADAIRGEKPREIDHPIVGSGGEEHYMRWFDCPLADTDANPAGLLRFGQETKPRDPASEILLQGKKPTPGDGEGFGVSRVSHLVEELTHSIDQVMQETVRLIPLAWLQPDATCARIIVRGREFRTDRFEETPWKRSHDIVAGGKQIGGVEVFYLEQMPESDEASFVSKERNLIEGIAARLGQIVERDDTEKEKAGVEGQLHQLQKLEAIGQLASGVAHNFSNLLAIISGAVGILKPRVQEQRDAAAALDLIEQAVEQGKGVTRSVLTFSRNVPAEKEPIDLGSAVEDAARLLARVLPATIDLVVEIEEDPALVVLADRIQLQQVVLNLAINARDAMPRGGTLQIGVARVAASEIEEVGAPATSGLHLARLTVSDTGIGIPREIRSRIFEPFFTRKARGQGTGLGLATVRSIVKDHKGWVTAHSALGRGSTFTVTLPLVVDAEVSPQVEPTSVTDSPRQTILLADSHQYIREIMAAMLESRGYNVHRAADSVALFKCHDRNIGKVALLIVDRDLPGQGGLECVAALRNRDIAIPAIILTNQSDPEPQGGLPSNTTLLPKPFDMSELSRRVSTLLCGPRKPEVKS